jgi:hypothetical protein
MMVRDQQFIINYYIFSAAISEANFEVGQRSLPTWGVAASQLHLITSKTGSQSHHKDQRGTCKFYHHH